MIAHQGGRTIYIGPKCRRCRNFRVKFEGEYCRVCRENDRDRNAMGAILLICLCAALLIMGFVSAHGQFLKMNGGIK